MHLVMTAAHGGYHSDVVPLGGGAAVCERLCRCWGDVRLTVIGSGPDAPEGVSEYVRVGGLSQLPSSLSELEYAVFSRRFEREASDYILALRPAPVVLSHDISEGPSFGRLARAGVDCLSILHVDVVDYFQRFYLGDWLPARWWAWLHRQTRQWPWPDLLQLVFEKQYLAARHCRYLVVPSQKMRDILVSEYPDMPQGRVQVIPWGSPLTVPTLAEVDLAKATLRERWGLRPDGPMVVTLSRISPEKSQDVLLQAVLEMEDKLPEDLTVAIVGAPSYMMGQRFLRRLQGLAARFRRVRVIFPGHLGGAEKRAMLEMATVFAVCSRHESYGLTIMEAMAAGSPILAVRSYGVDATVTSDCGRVLEPGPGLRSRFGWALLELLRHPELLQRMSGAARMLAEGTSFEEAADRLLTLCRGGGR